MHNMRLTSTIGIILTTLIVIWAWGVAISSSSAASLPWAVYDHSLYLCGFLSISLMSLAMLLAIRPAWLETPLGGLDQMYRLHKWTGILAVIFAAAHWLIEMGDDLVKAIFGRSGRLHEAEFSGFVEMVRDAAEDIGEWAIYLLLAMLALTLLKYFPYKFWRYLHRMIPVLYLLLAFHAVWLAPPVWWQQPTGLLMALLLSGGIAASLLSLSGRVGRKRRCSGRISVINRLSPDITEVQCDLGTNWPGHRAGQFALVTFNSLEGSHPFSLASANQGDGRVTFLIKALGDYTRDLSRKIHAGQAVSVEGPYGRFDVTDSRHGARQVWVAGGIGITPFLAGLEEQQKYPERASMTELHYCTANAATDPTVARLHELCAALPQLTLFIHDSHKGEKLSADQLLVSQPASHALDIWFCGPKGLARSLKEGLKGKCDSQIGRAHV